MGLAAKKIGYNHLDNVLPPCRLLSSKPRVNQDALLSETKLRAHIFLHAITKGFFLYRGYMYNVSHMMFRNGCIFYYK
jgi:hypothetical protein